MNSENDITVAGAVLYLISADGLTFHRLGIVAGNMSSFLYIPNIAIDKTLIRNLGFDHWAADVKRPNIATCRVFYTCTPISFFRFYIFM